MTKFLPSFALLAAIAAPAVASEAPTHTFTRDGQIYVYTSTPKGDATLLSGRAYPSGGAFELTVRGNRVRGQSNGVPVSFEVAAAPTRTATMIASR